MHLCVAENKQELESLLKVLIQEECFNHVLPYDKAVIKKRRKSIII